MRFGNILRIFRAKRLLGIDIGKTCMRLVELSYANSVYKVESCFSANLTSEATDEMIVDAIKIAVAQMKPKTRRAAVAISHLAIVERDISLDHKLTEEELEEFLPFSIEKYIGEAAQNISFDYFVASGVSKTEKTMALKLISVRRERVQRCVKLLLDAGLKPQIVDISSYALMRVIKRQFTCFPDCVAIINFDRDAILIVIIDQQNMLYAHEEIFDDGKIKAVDQFVSYVAAKLHLALATIDKPLQQIILTGENSTLENLVTAINTEFNVSTFVIDPFFEMKFSIAVEKKHAFAIGCGLALRVKDYDEC